MQPAGRDSSSTVLEEDTLAPVAATASAHAASDVMRAAQLPEVRMEEELTWVKELCHSKLELRLVAKD